MTREYRTAGQRPRADVYLPSDDYEAAVVRDLIVFERPAEWVDSGILDASGTRLMRRDRPGPIGFIHHQDRDA